MGKFCVFWYLESALWDVGYKDVVADPDLCGGAERFQRLCACECFLRVLGFFLGPGGGVSRFLVIVPGFCRCVGSLAGAPFLLPLCSGLLVGGSGYLCKKTPSSSLSSAA